MKPLLTWFAEWRYNAAVDRCDWDAAHVWLRRLEDWAWK